MHKRQPTHNSIQQIPKIIRARFASTCSCGKSIVPGEAVFYNQWMRGPCKCLACGQKIVKLQMQKLSAVQATPEAQQIINRINQLKALSARPNDKSQSELSQLIIQLKNNHGTDYGVMNFFNKFVQCAKPNSELVMIRAKFCGLCFHCSHPQKTGTMVLYDRVEKRLHCLECDCSILQNAESEPTH